MLSTENWIALLFVLLVPFMASILTLLHRLAEQTKRHRALQQAYQSLDQEMSQQTQSLRALNHSLYEEIRQHQTTAKKLQQSENYLHDIINSMPSVLIGVTPDGLVTHWNASAEKDSGLPEHAVQGKYLWEAYPHLPVDVGMIREALHSGQPKTRQNYQHLHQGKMLYLDITIYPLLSPAAAEAIIQVDDVTVRVMMKNRVIQNEKMMSLGELAAGMAHEINNPIGAILQNVQNIERRLSADLPQNHQAARQAGTDMQALFTYVEERQINKFLRSIRDAGERSGRIVSNMLEFSHRNQPHRAVNINQLVQHCLELAENNFYVKQGDHDIPITLHRNFDEQLPSVICSAPEIQQVLLNLLRNAKQCFATSLPRPNMPPQITVSTQYLSSHFSSQGKDPQVEIRVADNGPGMSDNVRRHIFEPFFTTKEVGQGTGLGLAISYFIVTTHHGGRIEVDSIPGHGSTFIITLPLVVTESGATEVHGNF